MESKMKKFIIKLLFSPRQRSSELGSALGLTKRSNIVRPFPAAAQPAQARRRPVGLAKTWIYAASFAAGMLLAGCDTDDEYRAADLGLADGNAGNVVRHVCLLFRCSDRLELAGDVKDHLR